jgi:hypothetical protein
LLARKNGCDVLIVFVTGGAGENMEVNPELRGGMHEAADPVSTVQSPANVPSSIVGVIAAFSANAENEIV